MSSVQNDPNCFRDLNLQRLKDLANSWVNEIGNEIPDVCIEDINLYKYYSYSAKNQSKKHPVKYCVVFGIKDEPVHESGSFVKLPIYSFLGIFQTVDRCRLLLDSEFDEAYNYRPGNDYENEWIFLTRKLTEGNPSVKLKEPYWVLYDATGKAKISRKLETEATQPPMQTNANNISPEDFIGNIRVSSSSDTSIFLQSKGGKIQEFACNDMGFKPTSETWKILIEILHDSNHQYYVGIYDKTKDHVKIKDYNKKIANMREFSKKFVSFLNQTYKVQIPENFKVFENKHRTGNDKPGTYTTKFKIDQHGVGIEELPKEEIIKTINGLTKQITNEESEKAKDRLCKQVKPYVDHAFSKGWITQEEYTNMITPDYKNPLHDDAMAYIDNRHQSF